MSRVKRGVTTHARHKKVLKSAKGYYGARSRLYGTALQAVEKASTYAYRDRKAKKRTFRALWIQRINAGVRELGMTYGKFINGLKVSGIQIERKILAEIAVNDPIVFKTIVEKVKNQFPSFAN